MRLIEVTDYSQGYPCFVHGATGRTVYVNLDAVAFFYPVEVEQPYIEGAIQSYIEIRIGGAITLSVSRAEYDEKIAPHFEVVV